MSEQHEQPGLSTADMVAASEMRPQKEPDTTAMSEPGTPANAARPPAPNAAADHPAAPEESASLLAEDEAQDFRSRWDTVQTGFVDEPRRSVEQADALVAEVMQRLAKLFADERGQLEAQWGRGEDVSTEDLRVALRRYRAFFDRLLSV
ncbi:MAG: hypothetical protein ACTHMJ_19230 [Thermomicrobiales bacterium]